MPRAVGLDAAEDRAPKPGEDSGPGGDGDGDAALPPMPPRGRGRRHGCRRARPNRSPRPTSIKAAMVDPPTPFVPISSTAAPERSQVGGDKDLGPSPTYIAPSADGRFRYVAETTTGAGVTAASIGPDHTPTKLETQQVQNGSSELQRDGVHQPEPERQSTCWPPTTTADAVVSFPVEIRRVARAAAASYYAFASDAKTHSVRVDRSGKHVFAPNLESNNIGQLPVQLRRTGQLTANTPATVAAAPPADDYRKAGPRHIALHPSKPYAYVANELNSTITAYSISTTAAP